VALVTDEQKDKTMIQELLNYKARLDRVLEEAFNKHDDFAYSLKVRISSHSHSLSPPPMFSRKKMSESKI
jgi:hypothetical protein